MKRTPVVIAMGLVVMLSACRTTPDDPPLQISDQSSPLQTALMVGTDLEDPLSKAIIHVRVAQAYTDNAAQPVPAAVEDDVRAVVARARELLDRSPITTRSTAALIDLAAVYLRLERVDEARELMDEVIARFQSDDRPLLAEGLLVDAVTVALAGGEAMRDLVRAAIDEVYVIETPQLRANTLIQIAEVYQAQRVGQSVTALIQQAMPAFRSVSDPWESAAGFSRAAVRQYRAGDVAASLRAAADAAAIAAGADPAIAGRTVRSAIVAQQTLVENLVLVGAAEQAGIIVASLSHPATRALLLARTAAGYQQIGELAQAVGALVQAQALVSRISSIEDQLAVLSAVAQQFVALDLVDSALDVANQAIDVGLEAALTAADWSTVLPALEQLGRVLAELDRVESLRAFLEELPSAYLRASVSLAAAEPLIAERLRGVADDLLVFALLQVNSETPSRDELLRDIVSRFASNGNFVFAMRAVERIGDRYLLALSLTELGSQVLQAGGLSANEAKLLDGIIDAVR